MHADRYHAIFQSEETNWWYRGRRLLINRMIRTLAGGSPLTMLDIGCGTGRNLMLLNAFGTAYGVDTAPSAIAYCRSRNLPSVHLIKDNTYPFEPNMFDLITCLDVIEHEKNERALLGEARRVLKKGGSILITVPANSHLWSRLDTDSHHLRRYDKRTLENLLSRNGFRIERISYFNFLLFLPILLVRLFQKTSLGKQTSWGIRPDYESPLANRLLFPLFALDIHLLRYVSPPFGVSLFAIAKKL